MVIELDEATFIKKCVANGWAEQLADYFAAKRVAAIDSYALRVTPMTSEEGLRRRDRQAYREEMGVKEREEQIKSALTLLDQLHEGELANRIRNNQIKKQIKEGTIDLAQALEELMHYLNLNPEDIEKIRNLAFRSLEVERCHEAIPLYELVLLLNPSNAQSWMEKGIAHCLENDWVKGRSAFEVALELSPDSPLLLTQMIQSSIALGDKDQAMEHYKRCKDLVKDEEALRYAWRQKLVELKRIIKRDLKGEDI